MGPQKNQTIKKSKIFLRKQTVSDYVDRSYKDEDHYVVTD